MTSAKASVTGSGMFSSCLVTYQSIASLYWKVIMAEMSVIWLRVAAALYSLGLLHSILTVTQRRNNLFGYALGAARAGILLHLVSVIEEGLVTGRCPIANFYETISMCALIILALFLVVHWRYKI